MSKLNRILVVDDDPVVIKSFERSLPKTEYVVVTANSGPEALEKLKDGQYDVVFTDIKMPGMSGLELTGQIKAKQSWTPVVIISGFGTQENQTKAQELGVADFIQKPLTPDMIKSAAQHAMQPAQAEWAITAQAAPSLIVEQAPPRNHLKNVALFLVAPIVGLVYALALPFVGLGMLAYVGGKKLLSIA